MNDKNYWSKKWGKSGTVKPNPFAIRAYRLLQKKRVRTMLDLGSGDGRDALYFANKGLSVYAVDFSKSGIEHLKRMDPSIHALTRDIRKLPFKKGSFDAVYAHLSLHYFSDKETREIFSAIRSMLKPGGLLFVKCKSTEDPLYGKGKKIGPDMYRKGHTRHFFSKEYMNELLVSFASARIRKTSGTYSGSRSSFIEAVAVK